MNERPCVLCIVGPTACHKTEVSVRLAKELNGEIVSADSVAIYRGLDIGSAKPNEIERDGIPHWLLDCIEPNDTGFSVAVYQKMAHEAIDDILSRGKLPIVVGGSGMYSDAIFSNLSFSIPSDPEVRATWEQAYEADRTKTWLYLCSIDPKTAERLHPNDKKRVVRAIEVYELSQKPFSEWNQDFLEVQKCGNQYRAMRIGLDMSRERLYERIGLRVHRMMEQGLKEEAYGLFDRGLTPQYPSMQSIGYAQLYEAYMGRCTVEEAVEKIILDTRHFAKRQLTWFRRNPSIRWFHLDAYDSVERLTSDLVQYFWRFYEK